MVLVFMILVSGFIYSRPHHAPLAYFITSFFLMIVTEILTYIIIEEYFDMRYKSSFYLKRLIVQSPILLALSLLMALCIRLKHRDFFII